MFYLLYKRTALERRNPRFRGTSNIELSNEGALSGWSEDGARSTFSCSFASPFFGFRFSSPFLCNYTWQTIA